MGSLIVETPDGDKVSKIAWKPLGYILGANLVFGALLGGLPSIGIPSFGLIAAIFALIIIASKAGDEFSWKSVLILATVLSIGSYLAFNAVAARGVRPIGVTGNYRSPRLPDVPTLIEQGNTEKLVTLEGGLPLVAPAGTPEPILKRLADEAVAWSNTDKAAKLRETFAIPNKPKNLAETRKDWEAEVPVWIKLAVDLGIKLD